ncbi:MAG TPA: hypothetical protein VHG70_13725 [Nocardioidaceae bacterium]|nr:hypothetical protein [Nocardioidaceae bacterium]
MYTGTQGWLRTTVAPPIVRSPNIRPGRGNDALWVRYRLSFVHYWGGGLVSRSGWSGWLRTRDRRYRTWNGFTYFDGLWNGVYQVRYRIEWWNQKRRIGVRSTTLQSYYYYDDQNAGPSGPNRACFKES